MLPTPPTRFHGPFRTDVDARASYSESAGILRVLPDAVAVPGSVEDLQELCRWASANHVSLVPRGSGSSMSGAAVGPGVVVDLCRFRAMGAVNESFSRLAVGAAVTRGRADEAARARGMRFPVDPSSGAFATLGGMASTNAAGARTLRFGSVRRWIHSVECVFADGTRATVSRDGNRGDAEPLARFTQAAEALRARAVRIPRRRVRKDSSGLGIHDFAESGSLLDLLIGSEGTLAFFTALELTLAPLPAATASLLSSWNSLEDAMRGAALAEEAGAVACELLDASFLEVAARGRTLPVPSTSECVLLVELEDRDAAFAGPRAESLAEAWRRARAASVLLGLDPESEESLWALRHAASPILARLDPHMKSMQVIEDGCVPPHRLPDYVRGVRGALADAGLTGVLFGHAGDANLHVNALVDVRDKEWKHRVHRVFHQVADLTSELGGTMTGEHGDGRLRSLLLERFWSPDALQLFADIKSILDPSHVLNPGVKSPPYVDPFARVKYDPLDALESLRAARVIERVDVAREYDSCRLELLDLTG